MIDQLADGVADYLRELTSVDGVREFGSARSVRTTTLRATHPRLTVVDGSTYTDLRGEDSSTSRHVFRREVARDRIRVSSLPIDECFSSKRFDIQVKF
jgi:hypothetical protein